MLVDNVDELGIEQILEVINTSVSRMNDINNSPVIESRVEYEKWRAVNDYFNNLFYQRYERLPSTDEITCKFTFEPNHEHG